MKRIYIILLLSVLCLGISAQRTRKQITILHSNDTHSCVVPMNSTLADTVVAGRGGFLRRITMLNEERKKDPDLLYIDSGDFSQGSGYYTLFGGEVEVALMNRMGLVASTIGNHEFDNGMENMAKLFKAANFPIICSNYDVSGTVLEGLVKPYDIVMCKGVKIGLFGLSPRMEGLVAPSNCKGVGFNDPVECALKTATMLKEEQHCDIVICISHLGWGENNDIAMVKGSRNIDLVLGGHSHTLFRDIRYVTNLDGVEVPVDQIGKAGVYVSRIVLDVEVDVEKEPASKESSKKCCKHCYCGCR